MPTMRNKKLVNESMGAKPKTSQKTGIARKLAMGTPLVASASGVKGGRGANRVFGALTGVTVARSGVKVDPLGVAMALPVGKILLAASKLRLAGRISEAVSLEARATAKRAGQYFGGTGKKSQGLGLPMDRAVDVGGINRAVSERLYPRLPGGSNLPRGSARTFDIYADPYLSGNERVMGAVVRRPSGSYGEAAMPRIGSQLNTGFTAASKKMGTVVRKIGKPKVK